MFMKRKFALTLKFHGQMYQVFEAFLPMSLIRMPVISSNLGPKEQITVAMV